MADTVDGPAGAALWARADRVLPGGGIYLTRSARFAGPGVQPGFLVSGEGCRVTDVDGRRYIDFLCANGPVLLGYRHPEVEAAARRQAEQVESVSYYHPALVELAERLVARTPGMAWAVPAKNGSDAVALGVRVARAASGHEGVVLFERAYHGFNPELGLGPAGIPGDHRSHTFRLPWNDVAALERVAQEQAGRLAAVVLNPLDQNPGQTTRGATPEFLERIRALQREAGARLVLDDVRAGFRLHARGSQHALGIEPDLIALGKGLGNGHAVSALLGAEALRDAARAVDFTASFIFTAVAHRAALATLEVYDRDGVFAKLWRAGERLRAGLAAAAERTGHALELSGPPSMPSLRFEDDPGYAKGRRFAREAALRGALFHPLLNGFLSAAHDDAAIDEAVEIAAAALEVTPLLAGDA